MANLHLISLTLWRQTELIAWIFLSEEKIDLYEVFCLVFFAKSHFLNQKTFLAATIRGHERTDTHAIFYKLGKEKFILEKQCPSVWQSLDCAISILNAERNELKIIQVRSSIISPDLFTSSVRAAREKCFLHCFYQMRENTKTIPMKSLKDAYKSRQTTEHTHHHS